MILKFLTIIGLVILGFILLGFIVSYLSRIQMRAWIKELFDYFDSNNLERTEHGKEEQ